MGRERYQRLQSVWFGPRTVLKLNEAFQQAVILPEVFTMDEKLKPFTGDSPYIWYVPNKDPPSGHWITEATMKAPLSGLPFLVNATPVQQAEGPSMLEFYQKSFGWMSEDQKKSIVIVSDAYYMDNASRTWLRDNGFKYLAAINPTRFAEVWEPLQLKVKKKKHVAVAWCDATQEAAVHFWTSHNKKAYLLTNAFTYEANRKAINKDIFSNTYVHLFNTADRLNHFIYKRGYPWRRAGWMYSFDNFHFTTLLWNIYVMYHELNQLEKEIDWLDFCETLAHAMWNKYC